MSAEFSTNTQKQTRISSAFSGPFLKSKPELSKQITALFILFLALLPPVLHVVCLGTVSYLFFYHVLFNTTFSTTSSVAVNALIMASPVLSGVALVAWMLRPFIPLHRNLFRTLPLPADQGPEIPELINAVRGLLGIRQQVDIKTDIRPVVYVQPGLQRKTPRLQLKLTLGLPLQKSLNTGELSALISHELGHYTNSVYALVKICLTKLESWYSRNLDGDDGWGSFFESLEKNRSGSLVVALALLGRLAIWLSNRWLKLLYGFHRYVSDRTLKRLERDADQTAVLFSGSDNFIAALKKQEKLIWTWQRVSSELPSHDSGHLVNDLPAHLNKIANGIDDKQFRSAKIAKNWPFQRLSTVHQRITYAKSEASRGIFTLEVPAELLCKDFQELCTTLTPMHYRDRRLRFNNTDLVPVIADDKQHRLEQLLASQLDEYTASTFLESAVWDVSAAAKTGKTSQQEQLELIRLNISQFREQLPELQSAILEQANCTRTAVKETMIRLTHKLGHLDEVALDAQLAQLQPLLNKSERCQNTVETWRQSSGLRVSAAVFLTADKRLLVNGLQLLNHLQLLQTVEREVSSGQHTSGVIKELQALMIEHADGSIQSLIEEYGDRLATNNRKISAILRKLPGSLKGVPSFESILNDRVANRISPSMDTASSALQEFAVHFELFCDLNRVIAGKLAAIAMQNEKQQGIEPVRLIPHQQHPNAA